MNTSWYRTGVRGHVDDEDFDKIASIPTKCCYDIKGILTVQIHPNMDPWFHITAYRCLDCFSKDDCPDCKVQSTTAPPLPVTPAGGSDAPKTTSPKTPTVTAAKAPVLVTVSNKSSSKTTKK